MADPAEHLQCNPPPPRFPNGIAGGEEDAEPEAAVYVTPPEARRSVVIQQSVVNQEQATKTE